MLLHIKLFASFRENRFTEEKREYPTNTRVTDIVEELNIEQESIGVTMINGRHCSLDAQLGDGDTLAIFPLVGGG